MVDATVHFLDRGRVRADTNFVVSGDVVASAADPNPDLEYGEFVVWNLLIDHPEATVLWDTGSHPDAGEGYWPDQLYGAFAHVDAGERDLGTVLGEAGYGIGDVDAVVTSHLHLDHAGGLYHFAGTDVPVYVHAEELPFAYHSANTDEGSIAYLQRDFDRDIGWEVVHGDRTRLFEGFELLHLPGHTPGLLGGLLHLPDRSLLIVGDEAYVTENYEGGQPMATSLLWSNREWFESLQRAREIQRRHGAEVLLGHDLERFEQLRGGW